MLAPGITSLPLLHSPYLYLYPLRVDPHLHSLPDIAPLQFRYTTCLRHVRRSHRSTVYDCKFLKVYVHDMPTTNSTDSDNSPYPTRFRAATSSTLSTLAIPPMLTPGDSTVCLTPSQHSLATPPKLTPGDPTVYLTPSQHSPVVSSPHVHRSPYPRYDNLFFFWTPTPTKPHANYSAWAAPAPSPDTTPTSLDNSTWVRVLLLV